MKEHVDFHDPCLVGVVEAGRLLGVGRSTVYVLLADKRLHAIKLGRRTLVHIGEVERLAQELAMTAGALLSAAEPSFPVAHHYERDGSGAPRRRRPTRRRASGRGLPLNLANAVSKQLTNDLELIGARTHKRTTQENTVQDPARCDSVDTGDMGNITPPGDADMRDAVDSVSRTPSAFQSLVRSHVGDILGKVHPTAAARRAPQGASAS